MFIPWPVVICINFRKLFDDNCITIKYVYHFFIHFTVFTAPCRPYREIHYFNLPYSSFSFYFNSSILCSNSSSSSNSLDRLVVISPILLPVFVNPAASSIISSQNTPKHFDNLHEYFLKENIYSLQRCYPRVRTINYL